MLRKMFYPKIEKPLNHIARSLSNKGISPNAVTLLGLVLSIIAALLLSKGIFFMAGIFILAGGFLDMLDGALARMGTHESKYGAFLDSVTDRYSDFFIIGGIAVFYANNNDLGLALLALVVLLGAVLTSYTKARMEGFQVSCNVGLIERTERICLIALGAIVPFLMVSILWLLAALSHMTVFQRIWFAKEKLNEHTT